MMKKYWPADLHLIGKDIVRFHSIYWPAFLMSAGIALPKQVYGHGFLLNKGEKMSKSVGNVVDPMDLTDAFGVDQLRYFLMREVTFGADGSYSPEAIVRSTNADLANSFGNLAQRSLSMIHKNLEGRLSLGAPHEADANLLALVNQTCRQELPRAFSALDFSGGIEEWMRAVFACNQYVDDQAPWGLKKSDPERMIAVLMTLFQAIRSLAIAIAPVVPEASSKLLDLMQIDNNTRDFAALNDDQWFGKLVQRNIILDKPQAIFPRLELPEETEDAG
jgi:methionyl-tRNA synthetase